MELPEEPCPDCGSIHHRVCTLSALPQEWRDRVYGSIPRKFTPKEQQLILDWAWKIADRCSLTHESISFLLHELAAFTYRMESS